MPMGTMREALERMESPLKPFPAGGYRKISHRSHVEQRRYGHGQIRGGVCRLSVVAQSPPWAGCALTGQPASGLHACRGTRRFASPGGTLPTCPTARREEHGLRQRKYDDPSLGNGVAALLAGQLPV